MIRAWWRTALGEGRVPSEDQEKVITAPHTGRQSVDAGAGTGKTATLALRALWLIESEHVRADQIVVVTFTRKAAAEIGARIADTIDRAIASGAHLPGDGRGVRCTTIHSLAADIRREYAFDLGFEAPPRAVSDGEAHAIFHDAFRALLDGGFGVDTSAFPVAEVNLELLERDLGKLALRLKNHGISPDQFESRALLEANRFAMQGWGQLYAVGKREPRTKCEPKDPASDEEIAREAERERANVHVVAALFRDFDRRLHERGAATYGDLIGETTKTLCAKPELAERLPKRWRYVLLDESQDTSDLQLAFIEALFGKPGDTDAAGMMPVGDARQAIYGFNGADEKVMGRLSAVAEKTHPLVVNRRSHQEIVDAGHAVLEAAGVINALTPRLEAQNGSGTLACVRVQHFGADGQTIKERVLLEAQAIAREIGRLLRDGATQMSDIAILVRRRTHATVYMRELNRHGISAALDRRSGLFDADEIRDVLAWMALLLDLSDRQAAVRVLQSPLCGLSDAAMITLAARRDWLDRFLRAVPGDPRDGEAADTVDADTSARLARVRDLLVALLPSAALPLSTALERILELLPIAASYVSLGKREGAETIGAQAIVNLASFELLAREFAADHPGARLRDFVDDIERRILYDDAVEEAELDLDGVRILTIHQAKGLEWPYVFVACSTKNQYATADPTDRVVIYDLDSGAFAIKNDVGGRETFRWLCLATDHNPSSGEREPEPQPRKQTADREQARVFYVALTRAKKRVYVTVPAPAPQSGKTGGEAIFIRSIHAWAQAQDASADLTFDAPEAHEPLDGSRLRATPQTFPRFAALAAAPASTYRPRISFTSISAFETCPRQARYRYRLLLPDLRDARPRFVGLDGNETPIVTNAARLGSLTHRALEVWGRAQIEHRRTAPGNGVRTAPPIAYGDAFASALSEFDDVTSEDATRARESGKRAAEALAGYTLLAVEEPFELVVGQTLVIGAVDLIAHPGDMVVVIDYKTGTLAGEKYALQLALYRRVAEQRYPSVHVGAAILRLAPDRAVLESASPLSPDDIDRTVAEVGELTSDEAKVGAWCARCSYRGSPCLAPLGAAV